MIHAIGVELQAALQARKYPFKVLDREPTGKTNASTYAGERVVIERDRGAAGSYAPPVSQHINPTSPYTNIIPTKITIFAKSPRASALEFEHEDRAMQIADGVVTALFDIVAVRKNRLTAISDRWVPSDDLEKSERWPGVKYELTFGIHRGVFRRDWDGEAQPEAEIAAFENETEAGFAGGSATETACGD